MHFPVLPFRLPIGIQVGVVAALFIAALVVLWTTGAAAMERERRRSAAKTMLEQTGAALARDGRSIIAASGGDLEFPDNSSRERLNAELESKTAATLARFDRLEGGYFVVRFTSFVGTFALQPALGPAGADLRPRAGMLAEPSQPQRHDSALPPLEADLIEIQVHAAIRKRHVLFSVQELDEVRAITVAIRTAPVMDGQRVLGATWVMTRLVDPLFVDRSLHGYSLAAGLALGGLALAIALTVGLARTVRQQAAERDRLQTDLRRSERLAALGKLLAGVAHEVRNPLAGIRSTAQLWQRGVVGLDRESLGGLVSEVDRLEQIVSRLLHFSRADAQDLVADDLNSVVSEAARLATGAAHESKVKVELALAADLPPVAMAAPALLQVFRNLTTNALHVMTSGGTLRLATRTDSARRMVQAMVVDTGPGLAPDVLKHLFEPFYTTKPAGTGLGLAIAREIALAHGGELAAANRYDGTGAIFTLSLPAAAHGKNGEPSR